MALLGEFERDRDRLAAIVHRGFLGAEEFIEAGNGGVGHGAHGAGTVEDECDFCFYRMAADGGWRMKNRTEE